MSYSIINSYGHDHGQYERLCLHPQNVAVPSSLQAKYKSTVLLCCYFSNKVVDNWLKYFFVTISFESDQFL